MPKLTACTNCNGTHLEARRVVRSRDVAGHRFTAELRAMVCASCGETFFRSKDLIPFERAIAHALLAAGETSPDALRFLRNIVPLTAREFAALLDVRHETVSRWENGKRPMDRASYAMLRQVVEESARDDHATVDYLRSLRRPPKLAKQVRLKLGRSAA